MKTVKISQKIFRIVEDQSNRSSYDFSYSKEKIEFLEDFIDDGKPSYPNITGYHYLLQTPFRYSLPVDGRYAARFKPPFFDRNVFYGSMTSCTACFECAYHFMKMRLHLIDYEISPVSRTCFSVHFEDAASIDLRDQRPGYGVLRPDDYAKSHEFSWRYLSKKSGENFHSVFYPSIRHEGGENIANFDITKLAKTPERNVEDLTFTFDNEKKSCLIENKFSSDQIKIEWVW